MFLRDGQSLSIRLHRSLRQPISRNREHPLGFSQNTRTRLIQASNSTYRPVSAGMITLCLSLERVLLAVI